MGAICASLLSLTKEVPKAPTTTKKDELKLKKTEKTKVAEKDKPEGVKASSGATQALQAARIAGLEVHTR